MDEQKVLTKEEARALLAQMTMESSTPATSAIDLRLADFMSGVQAMRSKGRIKFPPGLSVKTPARMADFMAGWNTEKQLKKSKSAGGD